MSSSIPAKVLNETSDICSLVIQQRWNDEILKNCQFPENLKLADITLVFKIKDKNWLKTANLLVSCLPCFLKDYAKASRESC